MPLNFNQWIEDFFDAAKLFFEDPALVFLGVVVVAQYIVFQFLNGVFFTPRDRRILAGEIKKYTFSDRWTIALQRLIGTRNILAWALSAYYVFGFAICTVFSIPLIAAVILDGGIKRIWIYLLITVIMWFVDLLVFIVYPVGPPIRSSTNSEYDNVRLHYFSWSDKLIGMQHNALPSGHIWTLVLAWTASIIEGLWFFIIFYTINLIIACIVITFTGDHYPIDILGSIICVWGLYLLFWVLIFVL